MEDLDENTCTIVWPKGSSGPNSNSDHTHALIAHIKIMNDDEGDRHITKKLLWDMNESCFLKEALDQLDEHPEVEGFKVVPVVTFYDGNQGKYVPKVNYQYK